jgi:hypothetical protein
MLRINPALILMTVCWNPFGFLFKSAAKGATKGAAAGAASAGSIKIIYGASKTGTRAVISRAFRPAGTAIAGALARIPLRVAGVAGIFSVAVWSLLTGDNVVSDVVNTILQAAGLPELPPGVINLLLIIALVTAAVLIFRRRR